VDTDVLEEYAASAFRAEVCRLSNSLGCIGRFNPEEGNSVFLRNVSIHLQDYTMSKYFPIHFNPEAGSSTFLHNTSIRP
jgi:hypothetical protein